MRTLFENAGIELSSRRITNHSGRISCASRLYNAGLDDKAISSRTGHRSNAIDIYKRKNNSKSKEISDFLQPMYSCSDISNEKINFDLKPDLNFDSSSEKLNNNLKMNDNSSNDLSLTKMSNDLEISSKDEGSNTFVDIKGDFKSFTTMYFKSKSTIRVILKK